MRLLSKQERELDHCATADTKVNKVVGKKIFQKRYRKLMRLLSKQERELDHCATADTKVNKVVGKKIFQKRYPTPSSPKGREQVTNDRGAPQTHAATLVKKDCPKQVEE